MLVGVEVGTVGGQAGQPQAQVGRGEVLPQRVAPMGRRGVPEKTSGGSGWRAPRCCKKATEVSAPLLPSNGMASTSPVSRQMAE
jgi:hypothetical protein